jgi:hypothetical protein
VNEALHSAQCAGNTPDLEACRCARHRSLGVAAARGRVNVPGRARQRCARAIVQARRRARRRRGAVSARKVRPSVADAKPRNSAASSSAPGRRRAAQRRRRACREPAAAKRRAG